MSNKVITVPRQMWYEEGELQLEFPESWEIMPCLWRVICQAVLARVPEDACFRLLTVGYRG